MKTLIVIVAILFAAGTMDNSTKPVVIFNTPEGIDNTLFYKVDSMSVNKVTLDIDTVYLSYK